MLLHEDSEDSDQTGCVMLGSFIRVSISGTSTSLWYMYTVSQVVRKPDFGVSDQALTQTGLLIYRD